MLKESADIYIEGIYFLDYTGNLISSIFNITVICHKIATCQFKNVFRKFAIHCFKEKYCGFLTYKYIYDTFLEQTILNNCSLYPSLRDFTELILLDSVCVLFCFQTILLFVLFSNYSSFFVFKQFFFLFCFQTILFFSFFFQTILFILFSNYSSV